MVLCMIGFVCMHTGSQLIDYMVECCLTRTKMTQRSLTAHVNKFIVPISRNALSDWLYANNVKCIKPRFQFCQTQAHMTALEKWGTIHSRDHWIDCLHGDEVWFYRVDLKGKYILLPEILARNFVSRDFLNFAVSSRGNIEKLMYLIVVARPRWEYGFDGKIGCWPVAEWRQAKRNSANRPAGTWEIKPVSMDAPMYLQMWRDLVAPAVVKKMNWICDEPRHLRHQDDNASSHCKRDMVNRLQLLYDTHIVAHMPGVATMSKSAQVPRSPNVNVLDLGVNRSIGQAVSKLPKKSITELLKTVNTCWHDFCPKKLERLFALCTINAKVYAASGGKRKHTPSAKLRSAHLEGCLWERVDEWQPTAKDLE